VAFYTIGQRKRLPAGQKEPLFVVALDAETNTVVVGPESELYATGFLASECNWIALSGPPQEAPLAVQVKIRYNGQAASALIREGDARGTIVGCFTQPQRAVTPGQSAVFYGGEGEEAGQVVLGGGILAGALKQSS
jgi:tRNA-specific 2-thiouridylase